MQKYKRFCVYPHYVEYVEEPSFEINDAPVKGPVVVVSDDFDASGCVAAAYFSGISKVWEPSVLRGVDPAQLKADGLVVLDIVQNVRYVDYDYLY